MDEAKYQAFCKEIDEVCVKYGYIIDGCGCCGSPYVVDVNSDKKIAEYEMFGKGEGFKHELY